MAKTDTNHANHQRDLLLGGRRANQKSGLQVL